MMSSKWLGVWLIVIAAGLTVWLYGRLPEQVPIHWGVNGTADRFADRLYGAWMSPLIMLILYGLMLALPKIDPKKDNYERFGKTYRLLTNGILLFLLVMHALTLSYSTGMIDSANYFIQVIVGLLFIFLGNYMPKVKHNYFIGIRTPWSLASEEVWKKTNRFGGKVFVVMGLLMMATIFLPVSLQAGAVIGVIIGGLAVVFISSYLFFVKR